MTPPRIEAVLILARGQSRRMGQPKGLCRMTPTGPTFLAAILDLYGALGLPVTVATLPDLVDDYQATCPEGESVAFLALPGGDDTARTVLASWQARPGESPPPTHLWLHPVDLPLVKLATLQQLQEASRARPDHVVRPWVTGQPGHPVIVPADLLDWAAARYEAFAGATMREVIAVWRKAVRHGLFDLPVEDPGCVWDMDDPAAVARWGKDETS